MTVAHIQPRGLEAISMHFHNGRTSVGLPHRRLPPSEVALRIAQCLALPARLVRQVIVAVRGRPGYRRVTLFALPLVTLLACAHAAGEAVGALRGPGRSAGVLE
jgi:hypothetical protein